MKKIPAGIEIWQIQNDEGHSLLHHAAQSNQPVIVRKLIKMANERIQSDERFKE